MGRLRRLGYLGVWGGIWWQPRRYPRSDARLRRIPSASRRIQAEGFFDLANALTPDVIQVEGHDRCPTDSSASLDFITFESEVFGPLLSEGMKQGHLLTCRRINGCGLVTFMEITSGTCQGEVFQGGLAALRAWDDMFDVKGSTLQSLMHQAVLASCSRPRTYSERERFGHSHLGPFAQNLEGFAANER